jgi:hypothetical protein
MKTRNNTYRVVQKLPANAVTVSEYATAKECGTNYLYKLWRQHATQDKEIEFEIVIFKGFNFVIPKSKTIKK